MVNYVLAIKHYLDGLDPKLWYLCLILLVGSGMEIWRQAGPTTFAKVPSRLKALPPILIAIVINATASDNLGQALVNAVIGSFLGLTAVGGYEAKIRLLSGLGSRDPKPPIEEKKEEADPPEESKKS